jgi:hypothetical protein
MTAQTVTKPDRTCAQISPSSVLVGCGYRCCGNYFETLIARQSTALSASR